MTIGPLQIVLVELEDEQRTKPVAQQLTAARKSGVIRLVDMLYMTKDLEGNLHSREISDLTAAQKMEYGEILKGLLEMRAAHKASADIDEVATALSLSNSDFGLTSAETQQLADHLANGASAMLALFEHRWAIGLKEAVINSGGTVVAQGMLSPTALAIGGLTLEAAVQKAVQIEAAADAEAAQKLALAESELAEAETLAAAKLAEADMVAADADALVDQRLREADTVAAAAIAASVRVAADELDAADAALAESEQIAAEEIVLGAEIAVGEIAAGRQIASETIAEGIQTAEEIKAAAAIASLKLLLEAELIKEEATREAVELLVSAALIERIAVDQAMASLTEG